MGRKKRGGKEEEKGGEWRRNGRKRREIEAGGDFSMRNLWDSNNEEV